jgi:hypothetical protein
VTPLFEAMIIKRVNCIRAAGKLVGSRRGQALADTVPSAKVWDLIMIFAEISAA